MQKKSKKLGRYISFILITGLFQKYCIRLFDEKINEIFCFQHKEIINIEICGLCDYF